MYHFFAEDYQIGQDRVRIVGPDVNHIKNVLRMKAGEELCVGNGGGLYYHCSITEINEDFVEAVIVGNEASSELPAKLYLFQGLPKGDKMELIIQKAVELGVYAIIPVASRRAVVKLDEKKAEGKVKRWNAIAESAAKQSGRGLIPQVHQVMTLKNAFSFSEDLDLNMIPYENARDMTETKAVFGRVKPGMTAGIFIGPEGGFEDSEIGEAVSHGVMPVTLGKRILRTETAGLAVISVLMFQLEN